MKVFKSVVLLAFSAVTSLVMAGDIKPYNQAQVDKLAAEGKPALLAIHANWCPTCRAQKPIVEGLMSQPDYKEVTTFMIDFDADKALLKKYKVGMQSTLIAFKGATEVGRSVGDTTKSGIEGLVKKTVN